MRIIQVNKFYYPKDGVSNYVLGLETELKKLGHEVAVFSMDNPKNIPSPYQKYFVSYISFDSGGIKNAWRAAFRIFYSREAKRKFESLIKDFRPDIIHIHNIYHQISPSILSVAKKYKIPVVMHLHDYKLICPNYRLFTKNNFCRKCLDKKSYWPCLYNNCYESTAKSFLASLEMTIHHKMLHIYEKNIDLLIAPSEFMRQLVIASGWPEKKIVTVYNPAPLVSEKAGEGKDYLLYFGRLAQEKGITDLIKAAKNSGRELHIAGEGPEKENIQKNFGSEIKNGRIKLLGRLSGKSLSDEIDQARAVVFPSIWPENMPLALLESLAKGKITIASRVGGLPEIIKDKKNGFLFKAGNIPSLEKIIKSVWRLNQEESQKVKLAAIATAKELDPNVHLAKILKIYSKLAKKPG